MTTNDNWNYEDATDVELIQIHDEPPEVHITKDRKQVWVDDWLVWEDGHFISPNRRYQK